MAEDNHFVDTDKLESEIDAIKVYLSSRNITHAEAAFVMYTLIDLDGKNIMLEVLNKHK